MCTKKRKLRAHTHVRAHIHSHIQNNIFSFVDLNEKVGGRFPIERRKSYLGHNIAERNWHIPQLLSQRSEILRICRQHKSQLRIIPVLLFSMKLTRLFIIHGCRLDGAGDKGFRFGRHKGPSYMFHSHTPHHTHPLLLSFFLPVFFFFSLCLSLFSLCLSNTFLSQFAR